MERRKDVKNAVDQRKVRMTYHSFPQNQSCDSHVTITWLTGIFFSIEVIQLSKKVLNFEIDKRLTLEALLKCDWLKNKKTDEAFSVHSSKRLKLSDSTCFSQPELQPNDDRNNDEEGFGSPDPHMDLQFVLPQVQKFLGSSQPVSKE